MKLTIARKLGLGFLVVILLMLINSTAAIISVRQMTTITHEMATEQFPTAVACEQLSNGINQAVAALSGYIILGDNPAAAENYKRLRADAWTDIDRVLDELEAFSRTWSDDRAVASLEAIRHDADTLRGLQQKVEDIAHTEDNVVAYRLLRTEAAPISAKVEAALTAMIDIEEGLEATEQRKKLIKALADVRATFISSVAGARAYLVGGSAVFYDDFVQNMQHNSAATKRVMALQEALTPQQREHWAQFTRLRDDFAKLAEKLIALRTADDWNQANHLIETQSMPLVRHIRGEVEQITQSVQRGVEEDQAAMAQAQAALNTSLIIVTTVAVIISIIVASLLSRRIVNSVQRVVERARSVAEGDLAGERIVVGTEDEIAELADTFNTMTDSLRDLASQIGSVSGNIDATSAQVLAASKQQVAGTREQSAAIQQVTSTMRELTESGKQISGQAKDIASSAEATSDATISGQEAAQNTNQNMDAIRQQVEEVAENIVALSEKTQTIGEIIATVNDIAEQSNLLALNASIESVSAGEQGSRFTVVANEMKNLADQAKESTVQVRNILSDIQKGINTSVMLTEEAVKRVESGKQQADMTEQTIREMGETTSRSIEAFQQIAGGTSQQQIGFDQISQGMGDISTAAEQTAAGTKQLESAAASLSALSQQLQTAVGRYRV